MALCKLCGQEIPEGETLCAACAEKQTEVTALPEETAAPAEGTAPAEEVSPATAPQFKPDLPAPRPVTPAFTTKTFRLPPSEDQLPEEYEPIGAWGYVGYQILFAIPVIGQIFLLVFALGGIRKVNVKKFARSYFCWLLLAVLLAAVCVLILLLLGTDWLPFELPFELPSWLKPLR